MIQPSAVDSAASFWTRLRAKLTAQPVLWLFLITFLVVAVAQPVKVGLLFWGICKLAAFAFAGDWIDARIFHDTDAKPAPADAEGITEGTRWKRKAWIVCAAIIAGALLA